MHRRSLLLSTVVLALAMTGSSARAQQAVKPYIHVIVDTSGSMVESACSGCGTRMEEVVYALRDIFAGIGEVTFGLQSFIDLSDCGTNCNNCSNRFCAAGDVLVNFAEGNQAELFEWVDLECSGTDLELRAWGGGNTPIQGNLTGAVSHMTGVIGADPKNTCRPYVVVFMTDGEENCDASDCSGSVTQVQNLCNISVPGRPAGCTVPTYMIGLPAADLVCLDSIQANAGTTRTSAIVATERTDLALAFQEIVADSVLVEVCDELEDEDCDGVVDEGFQLYCDLPNGVTDNVLCTDPGDPCDGVDDNCFAGIDDELRNACGSCGPAPAEACDEVDNDCDGFIDEGLGCTPSCTPTGDEVCNTLDDDCDGLIDEADPMAGAVCGSEEGTCTPGRLRCINGELQCVGGMQPRPEVCDGLDNDCDGDPDNDAECPPRTVCIDAACRPPCDPDEEFPCPVGLSCEKHTDGEFYCVPSGCAQCGPDERCVDRSCVDLCADVQCPGDESCQQGECVGCAVGGCDEGTICVADECVEDPCDGIDCEDGQACFDGECRTACDDSTCPRGERCTADWSCAPDACSSMRCDVGDAGDDGDDGDDGKTCVAGACVVDACDSTTCNDVEVCVAGEGCVPDPCLRVRCSGGTCQTPNTGVPRCVADIVDPDDDDSRPLAASDLDPGHVIASGGGGCTCRAGGAKSGAGDAGSTGSTAWPLGLALLLLWRRRR